MAGALDRAIPRAILSLAWLATCAGCGAAERGQPTREIRVQEIPAQRIQVGMMEEQVLQRLGPPAGTVGAKIYPDGIMEVRHYVVNRVNYMEETASKKEFYFYFWNRQLVRWDLPDEWEREADRLHDELRRR